MGETTIYLAPQHPIEHRALPPEPLEQAKVIIAIGLTYDIRN